MKKLRSLGVVCAFILNFSFVIQSAAEPITIGPYTFTGPEAFPTDAVYISGQTTYIEHPSGSSWNSFPGNSTTDLDAALTGYDITLGVDGEGIVVDLLFEDTEIINGPGPDLVIFETVFEENFDLAIFIGDTLSSNLTFWSVSTGLTVGDVVGTSNTAMLNVAEIDLSDFGIALGETVSKIRLYTQPVGIPPEDSTAGADVVAIGALNTVPIPAALTCLGDSFEPPFNETITLKNKVSKAIPVKMTLVDADGNLITEANISSPPVVNVSYTSGAGADYSNDSDLVPPGLADDGNEFRYDYPYWLINLATKQFTSAGTYEVTAVAGDDSYMIDASSCSGTFIRLP